jgi:ferredoxin
VDRSVCLSTGMCTTIAPEIFELVDGSLTILVERLADDQVELVEDAIACCPVEALSLEPD